MSIEVNLLLRQEIRTLRAENERKIKKKARKHTTIGTKRFMNVQEGCDGIQ
jgi:hypothetical protein